MITVPNVIPTLLPCFIFHVWSGGLAEEKRRMSKVKKNDVVVKYMGTMAR